MGENQTVCLIENLIKRPGGSDVELDGKVYEFRADDAGRHVCEVTNPRHIQRFLSITEGYQLVSGDAPEMPEPEPPELSEGGEGVDGDGQPNPPVVEDNGTEGNGEAGPNGETAPGTGEPPSGDEGVGDEVEDYADWEKKDLLDEIELRGMNKPHHATGEDKLRAMLLKDDAAAEDQDKDDDSKE